MVNKNEYQITCFLNRNNVRNSAYSNAVPSPLRPVLSQYYLPGGWIHDSSWDWLRNRVTISDVWWGEHKSRGHFILTDDNGHCTTDCDGDDASWIVSSWNWYQNYGNSLGHSLSVNVAYDEGNSIFNSDYYTDQQNTYAMYFTELDGSNILLQKPIS